MYLDRSGGGTRKQGWIASQLRRVYDEALQEEIPAEMLALLEQLDDDAPAPGAPTPDGADAPDEAADAEPAAGDDSSEETRA